MSDIANWLDSIGLRKYADVFDASEIDLDAVRHLTEQDLIEIGLPIGPRRKVLAAILSHKPLKDEPSVGTGTGEASERRHITVVFADIVGSTELSERLDPEILSELLRAYQNVVSQQLRDFGGHLAKFMGDGVMAYFGWPQASEDAVERALRASLEIIAAVTKIRTPDGAPLQLRIGIASGLVVVGGLIGSGAAQEEAIAGDTPNLAARLQALALPNCILISEDTHRLVGSLFDCEAKGEHALKGFSHPVAVWCVLGESPNASRFKSVRGKHAGFFGRGPELELLHARWEGASAGNGYAAVILGEAGIGKSRLVAMLRERISGHRHNAIFWQCSPYHTNSALHPVIQYIEAAASIVPTDTKAEKFGKLESLLAKTGIALDRAVPLLADLLSIPLDEKYRPAQGTPAQRKSALISVLAEWIARSAEGSPLLLVLEDAHWIDATTQELITRLILAGSTMPALIVVTGRPTFAAPWIGRPRVGLMTLDPLTKEDCARVIASVVAARRLKEDIIAGIIAKSDGNPLFLEELTEAVLVSSPANSNLVPDTLQDSLMSRLDAMGDAKEVAQVAAVIGRRFSLPLLAVALDVSSEALDAAISRLVSAELVYPVGRIGDATYEFKHALVLDAAYESLLRARRRVLHERIGRALETTFAKGAQSEPELLAYHFSQAGLAELASLYGERAGDRAAAQFSYAEAIASYRSAIAENSKLAEGVTRDRRELSLLLKLGPAVSIISGPQNVEVGNAYSRAAKIAGTLDDVTNLFQATWGLWYHANVGRDLETAKMHADALVGLSDRSHENGHLLEALHSRWSTGLFRGEAQACATDAERGLGLYDPARHHALGITFGGHDPGVCAYGVCGVGLCLSGHPDAGRQMADKAVALAESLSHPPSMAHGLHVSINAFSFVFDRQGTESRALRLMQLSEKYNFPPLLSVATFFQAWSMEYPDKRVAAMQAEFARVVAIGPMPAVYTTFLADELVLNGRAAEALCLLDGLLADLKIPDTGLYLSEIHRIRGECLAAHDPINRDGAMEAIDRAIRIARAQGARLLELRAAMSALRVSPSDDHRAAMRALFESFTEGFECETLIFARELLEL